jgi:hypothetical protein
MCIDNAEIIVSCPHCSGNIIIMSNEINCNVFRHGIYKKNGQQMNPHERKEICDKLFAENLIFGCGKPFTLKPTDNKYTAEICEYI